MLQLFPSGRIISNKLILNGALIHFGSIHQLSWDCVATTKCVIAIKIEHKNFLCFQGSSLWPNIGIYWIRFLGGILPSTYYYVVRDLSIFFGAQWCTSCCWNHIFACLLLHYRCVFCSFCHRINILRGKHL